MTIEHGLLGHWPLAEDSNDHSPTGLPTQAVAVSLGAEGPGGRSGTAATFNGRMSLLEVPDHPALRLGTGDVTVAAWVRDDPGHADVMGDIVSKFDPAERKGLQLSIVSNFGVTSTAQANRRQLSFGIDNQQIDPEWTDCGRPGEAVLVTALHVSGGVLYAGTMETGRDQAGQVWRYEGGSRWAGLGNPDGCNAVHSVTEFKGRLYCGTARYLCSGSVLGETLNTTPGGKVYRLETGNEWVYCGQPGAEGAAPEDGLAENRGYASGRADDAKDLSVFRGALYGVSNHRCGVFKYEGGERWRCVGLRDLRIMTLMIFRGELYALINGGPVFRYEGGDEWTDCGTPEGSKQTYSAAVHRGDLYVGTWPEGEVFRYAGEAQWDKVGRVGYSREIMGMVNYNGKVFLGSLPMANMWRMDEGRFSFMGNLDASPVQLRRVWSMAVYGGRLYAGTLPSGRVFSLSAGRVVTLDRAFPAGWHHVAAVKRGEKLAMYVDGVREVQSQPFSRGEYDLDTGEPLRIGLGAFDYFRGSMSDVRLYGRALDAQEIGALSRTASV